MRKISLKITSKYLKIEIFIKITLLFRLINTASLFSFLKLNKTGEDPLSKICVNSEINTLKTVIIHTPGRELELMTPDTAEEVLYDDILNLENSRTQYAQLKGVLQRVSQPLEVNDLLIDILEDTKVHDELIRTICMKMNSPLLFDWLMFADQDLLIYRCSPGNS